MNFTAGIWISEWLRYVTLWAIDCINSAFCDIEIFITLIFDIWPSDCNMTCFTWYIMELESVFLHESLRATVACAISMLSVSHWQLWTVTTQNIINICWPPVNMLGITIVLILCNKHHSQIPTVCLGQGGSSEMTPSLPLFRQDGCSMRMHVVDVSL